MKKGTATVFCSLAILSGFFLPIFNWHSSEMSGPNYVLSAHFGSHKYILLLIPCSAIAVFWGTIYDRRFAFQHRKLTWTPLLSLTAVSFFEFAAAEKETGFWKSGSSFSIINIGFWVMLFFSLLILFSISRPRHSGSPQ